MADYISQYTGGQIDSAVGRALPGGTLETLIAEKAPGGYGWGEVSGKQVTDYNDAIYTGLYWGSSSEITNYPALIPNAAFGVVFAISKMDTIYHHFKWFEYEATRSSSDNGATWGEWAYVNPPMELGVEYLTTERYLGKPVYAKAISFGSMPTANTAKQISPGIENGDDVFFDKLTLSNGASIGGQNYLKAIFASHSQIEIIPSIDLSAYTAVVCIKYTKTTD